MNPKMKQSNLKLILLVILALLSPACNKSVIRQSFDGKLSILEGNRVIYEYCQGCHAHRNLLSDDHVIEVSKKYPSEMYKRAKECRTCHYIEKNFWGNITRKTWFPNQTTNNQITDSR